MKSAAAVNQMNHEKTSIGIAHQDGIEKFIIRIPRGLSTSSTGITTTHPSKSSSMSCVSNEDRKMSEAPGKMQFDWVPNFSNTAQSNLPTDHQSTSCVLRTWYEPYKLLYQASKGVVGGLLEVLIPQRMLYNNPAVTRRAVWGGVDGVYSDDSDAVCILLQQHKGRIDKSPIIKVTFQISHRLDEYPSHEANGIKSRSWRHHTGLSLLYIGHEAYGNVPLKMRRRKIRPQKHYPDGCVVKFSPQSHSPAMPISDLSFSSPRLQNDLLKGAKVILEGRHHTYRLKMDDTKTHYRIWKDDTILLFDKLKWTDLGWTEAGLAVGKTFLTISFYRVE